MEEGGLITGIITIVLVILGLLALFMPLFVWEIKNDLQKSNKINEEIRNLLKDLNGHQQKGSENHKKEAVLQSGHKKCPTCSRHNAPNVVFCPGCGGKMQ